MELADCGKPQEAPETKEHEDKSNNITIDISLIMGKMGGKPHGGGREEDDDCDEDKSQGMPCLKDLADCDEADVDWKSLAKQLLQAVSMMDTHTDGVNSGTEDPEHAIKAIDNETSRVLWGKQEEDNPRSSYQNANYGETTANGLVMKNPAELCNDEAYGGKAEKPAPPRAKPSMPSFDKSDDNDKFDDDKDDKFDDDKDDKFDKPDEPDDFDDDDMVPGKGFKPDSSKKPSGFKKAAESIIKRGEKKSKDEPTPEDKLANNKEDEVG